jgi:citrate synthase
MLSRMPVRFADHEYNYSTSAARNIKRRNGII